MKPVIPAWAATWIEHWPAELLALSFDQRGLALRPDEVRALGRRNGRAVAAFGAEPAAGHDATLLQALALRLDGLLQDLGGTSAFVRLGSRSPKDTPAAVLGGLQVHSGREAVDLLSAGSERMGFDLRVALQAGLAPWVFLREWVPMAWHEEWRGFLRGGRLVGACAYQARTTLPLAPTPRTVDALQHMAAALAGPLAAAGVHELVFDLWLPQRQDAPPRLIEINPWGPPTDAGLFSWAAMDFDGQLRWQGDRGLASRTLVADDPA